MYPHVVPNYNIRKGKSSNMSFSLSLHIPKALPPLSLPHSKTNSLFVTSKLKPSHNHKRQQVTITTRNLGEVTKCSLAIQLGALLAMVEKPALAVTGVNNEEDLIWVLIQLAIVAFGYFIVAPPIILNWCRIRWYKRKFLEMYLQFMFIFIFFPGIMLWAPFLNFRRFPSDPSIKYPWSIPENPDQIKNSYLRYPFATEDDYD